MLRVFYLTALTFTLLGCGPSYEAEYQAALKELESVKLQLAEAQQKLSAADHETRSKIFLLVRRARNHLQSESLNRDIIDKIQQEMQLLAQSYAQLNSAEDLTAVTAGFYADKLSLLMELERESSIAYDRQYNACLSDLESQGKKNDLSTMLCEVQADAAGRNPRNQFLASLTAVNQISVELHQVRQQGGQVTSSELIQRFEAEVDKQLADLSG